MWQLIASDVAGTTIDERDHVYRVLRETVEDRGARITDEQFRQWMGTEKREAITNLLSLGGVTADTAFIDEAYESFRSDLLAAYREHPPIVFPQVRETIAALRSAGIRVALTTGFSRDVADAVLDAAGLLEGRDLDAVVPASEVSRGRPAPYMIQEAMARTGADDVRQVIAIGDTLADIEAARRAGVTAVAVRTGGTPEEDLVAAAPDHIIDDFSHLAALIGVSR